MRILSIKLQNIKAHRDAEYSFAPGINVLSGPNGIGKSTIFEAVGYALFGVDARDFVGNIERFVSIGQKKGEISVVFQPDADTVYKVSRTVGSNAKWLLAQQVAGDFEVEDHANADETQARIKELLGLANGRSLADQFKMVIGPLQNDFLGPFVIRQATRRQEAFDEILGIDAWRKTYKGSKALLNAVGHKIALLDTEITEKQKQLAVLPERQKQLEEVLVAQKEHQAKLTAEQTAEETISTQLQQLDQQKESLEKLRSELMQLRQSISLGKEHIESQQSLVQQAEEAIAKLASHRKGKDAYEQAETLLHQLRAQEQQRRLLEQKFETLSRETLRLTENYQHERKEIDRTQLELESEEQQLEQERGKLQIDPKLAGAAAQYGELQQKLEAAQTARNRLEGRRSSLLEGREKLAEGVCPFFQEACQNIAGSPPRDVFSRRLGSLEDQQGELAQQITDLRGELETAEAARKQLDKLKLQSEGLERRKAEFEQRRNRFRERKAALKGIDTARSEAQTNTAAAKKELDAFAALDEQIKQAELQRKMHQKDRDEFYRNQQAAEDLGNRRTILEKYQQRMIALDQELKKQAAAEQQLAETYNADRHQAAKQQQTTLREAIAALKEQLKSCERDRQRLEGEIMRLTQLQQEIDLRLSVKRGFEEKAGLVKFLRNRVFRNVSEQLSERFREEISQRADRIYRTIAEADEELYWGKGYQIVLRDLVDGQLRERTDEQLSGGQTMSAVVALRLALLQTIGARIAFFDEPTSNLDATRRENLAQAFRAIDVGREELTEHWYDQLFLISHDVAFTEVTDQVVSLEPEN